MVLLNSISHWVVWDSSSFKATIPPMLCNTARLDLGSQWSMATFVFFYQRCLPSSPAIEFSSVIPTGQFLFICFQKKKKAQLGSFHLFVFFKKKKHNPTGQFLQTKTMITVSSKSSLLKCHVSTTPMSISCLLRGLLCWQLVVVNKSHLAAFKQELETHWT